jgi:hypothetical protein
VNTHPVGLAELKGTGKKDAAIQVSVLQKPEYNFNLTGKMGTLLRDGDKPSAVFTTLENIRDAYERAFFDHGTNIMAALRERSISDLCLLRNLIVHKGTICDDKYKRAVAGATGTVLPICEIGDTVPVDGELCGKLISSATDAMCRLIKSVDSWIAGHP